MSSTTTHDGLSERSFGELAKQFSQDVSELMRKEAELAKTEVAAKGQRLAKGAAVLAAAAVLGLVMLGALTATAILALATTLASWLAALIVAAVVGVVAGVLALTGLKLVRRATPPAPTETAESVKEDVAWIKTRAKSGMK
jgi:Putative Actinobacterial Holin-X, holin superfamily III